MRFRFTRRTAVFLAVTGGLYAQADTPETQKNPMAGDRNAVAAGKKLYDQACQGCHGPEGRGDRGPALAASSLRRGSADGEIFMNIRTGIRGTQMPAFSQLSADQVWQLVTYIRSLSGPAPVTETVAGDPAHGKSIFNGKAGCAACHQVNGVGTPVGPDLSLAGSTPAQQLRDSILNPNQPPVPVGRRGGRRGFVQRPATVIAKTKDGHEYRGVRKNEDTFTLQMVDTTGQLRLFDKAQLSDLRIERKSLMPDDYGARLSAAELQNVVAYLKTLKVHETAMRNDAQTGLTYERIRNAQTEPQNWLTYWGDYGGRHFTALDQINKSNVHQLQAKWAVQMPGDGIVEAIPLVVDGVMYTTGPPGEVFALDARTGRQIWKYQRPQKIVNPYESNRVNRGVAVLGNRVFFGTLDAALVALDARTGALLWESQVANTMEGYSITAAPLVLKDKIITGVAGGEYGIRGFIDAYEPVSGKRLWRSYTIPATGEFGNDTWEGDSWKHGGSPTWLTGSFDPELNTLYWAVGNPGPDVNGDVRKGDNLFSCSVIALDPDTGKRKWHYQFTPNDTHDWDATEDLVLVDRVWHGQPRKLLLQANRNGIFYVLDRTNGKLLAGSPFVRATWVKGWDENGRPITTEGWRATPEGAVIYPTLGGGSNFQAPSYSPKTGWMYFAYIDASSRYSSGPATYEAGRQFWGRGSGGGFSPPGAGDSQGIQAMDPETGKVQWKFELTQASLAAGVLATAGDVVFAASREGNFIALDAQTGRALWYFGAGADIASSPMSYSVDGKQYVAVSSAGVLYSFGLPD